MKRTTTLLFLSLALIAIGTFSRPAKAQTTEKPIVLAHTYQETFSDTDAWGYHGGGDFGRVGYGVYFGEEYLKPFVGGKITKIRFYIPCNPNPESQVCLYRTEYSLYDMKPIPEPLLKETMVMKKGWNEYILRTPIEITKGEVISAVLTNLRGTGPFASQDPTLAGTPESTMLYQPPSMAGSESWNPAYRIIGISTGPIPIQIYVTGQNLDVSSLQNKIYLQTIATDGYYVFGLKSIPIRMRVANAGANTISKITLAYSYDNGKEQYLDVAVDLPIVGADKAKAIIAKIYPPTDVLRHVLNVRITKVNDVEVATPQAPISRMIQMYTAENTFPRNTLIEAGVSSNHFYSPNVNEGLRLAVAKVADRANCIEYHYAGEKDSYIIPNSAGGWVDRYNISYTLLTVDREAMVPYIQASSTPIVGDIFGAGYDAETVAKYVESHILNFTKNYPGYAKIEVENTAKETGKYQFEVKGLISKDIPVDTKMKLVLLVTEDGLWQPNQAMPGGDNTDYQYDFTARMYVTDPAGDAIEIKDGGAFTYSSSAIDFALSGAKARVVAFVVVDSPENQTAFVLNSASLTLATGTGVLKPASDRSRVYVSDGRVLVDAEYRSLELFDINGRRVCNAVLQPGVYVAKVVCLNGELIIRKLIVH